MKTHICKHCQKSFYGADKKRYCSDTCKEEHLKRVCAECGTEFIGRNNFAKFCSGACQLEDQKRRQREQTRKHEGKSFYSHEMDPKSNRSFFESEAERRIRLGRPKL